MNKYLNINIKQCSDLHEFVKGHAYYIWERRGKPQDTELENYYLALNNIRYGFIKLPINYHKNTK